MHLDCQDLWQLLTSMKMPMDFTPKGQCFKLELLASNDHPNQGKIFNAPFHLFCLKLILCLKILAAVLITAEPQRMQKQEQFYFDERQPLYPKCSSSPQAIIYWGPNTYIFFQVALHILIQSSLSACIYWVPSKCHASTWALEIKSEQQVQGNGPMEKADHQISSYYAMW